MRVATVEKTRPTMSKKATAPKNRRCPVENRALAETSGAFSASPETLAPRRRWASASRMMARRTFAAYQAPQPRAFCRLFLDQFAKSSHAVHETFALVREPTPKSLGPSNAGHGGTRLRLCLWANRRHCSRIWSASLRSSLLNVTSSRGHFENSWIVGRRVPRPWQRSVTCPRRCSSLPRPPRHIGKRSGRGAITTTSPIWISRCRGWNSKAADRTLSPGYRSSLRSSR